MGRRADGWKLRQKKGSPYYFVRFTDPNTGERIDRSTGRKSKSAAAAEAAKKYAQVVSGEGLQVARGKQAPAEDELVDLVAEWVVHLEDIGKSEGWVATCETYAAAHWSPRWSSLDDITGQSVQKYISERRRAKNKRGKRISPVTIRKELSALNTFLRWCKTNGFIAEVPTWESPKGKSDYEAVCLTREQMQAVLEELPTRDTHPRKMPCREWYAVMWATSFRRGTMARIKWKDIDLRAGTIRTPPSADKKRHGRTLPLTPEAHAALKSMGPGVGLVFGMHDFRARLRTAAKAVGVPADIVNRLTGNHSIRHTRITDFATRSKNVAAIQYMAGHKDLASTMKYVHGDEERARDLLIEVGDGVAVEPKKSKNQE